MAHRFGLRTTRSLTRAAGLLAAAIAAGAPLAAHACPGSLSPDRRLVNRLSNAGNGEHFYTAGDAEALALAEQGWTLEAKAYYAIEAAPAPGLVPWYRCALYWGRHLYTTSPTCEGAGNVEEMMGYVATSPIAMPSDLEHPAIPLYRLANSAGDHLFTTSAAERSAAIAYYGYVDEGVAAHVWSGPAPCKTMPPATCGDGACDSSIGESHETCAADCAPGGNAAPVEQSAPIDHVPNSGSLVQSVVGQIRCVVPDSGHAGSVIIPAAGLPVVVTGDGGSHQVVTDDLGHFTVPFDVTPGSSAHLHFVYRATAIDPGSFASTEVTVVDDFYNARSESRVVPVSSVGIGVGDVGQVDLSSLDCELFANGVAVARDFMAVKHDTLPGGTLKMLRRDGLWVSPVSGTPYTLYDHVNFPTDYRTSLPKYASAAERRATLFHEAAHVARDLYDGDDPHWAWDEFIYNYARPHDGTLVTTSQFAFHEGFAEYWEQARAAKRRHATASEPKYLKWNEGGIADRFLELSQRLHDELFVPPDPAADATYKACSATQLECGPFCTPRCKKAHATAWNRADATMLATLEAHPGQIHTVVEFETFLAESRGWSAPSEPGDCPPDFSDDGLFCRRDVQIAGGYWRGFGDPVQPTCPGGQYDAGLCYGICAPGYHGVGPMCWENSCPPGYRDDGLSCFRDASVIWSDNSACSWWDICGVFSGCSSCPAGYHNDGCTCSVPPDLVWKASYWRGFGTVPSYGCAPGLEQSGLLCYPPCTSQDGFDFHGVGPACEPICHEPWHDDGATCSIPTYVFTQP